MPSLLSKSILGLAALSAAVMASGLLASTQIRVLSTETAGPRPTWSGGPAWAVLLLRQDPSTHTVSVSVLDSSSPDFAEMRAQWVSGWSFGSAPAGTTAPHERMIVQTDGGFERNEIPGLVQPTPVSRQHPEFPSALFMHPYLGRVTVSLIVDPSGKPNNISIRECTHPEFGAAAIQALRNWTFTPATFHDQAYPYLVGQAFRFEPLRAEGPLTLAGVPALPEHRERLSQGASPTLPQFRRFTNLPTPFELIEVRRPTEVLITLAADEKGVVTAVDLKDVPEPWSEPLHDIVRTWRFTPAKIGDEAVPWVMRIQFNFENRDLQTFQRHRRRMSIPQVEELDRVPELLASVRESFRSEAPPPQGGRFAEIDILVSVRGTVSATQLVDTNDPEFARHARSYMAYNVYESGTRRGRPTAFWIRQSVRTGSGDH